MIQDWTLATDAHDGRPLALIEPAVLEQTLTLDGPIVPLAFQPYLTLPEARELAEKYDLIVLAWNWPEL
jgi:hypothetical protein